MQRMRYGGFAATTRGLKVASEQLKAHRREVRTRVVVCSQLVRICLLGLASSCRREYLCSGSVEAGCPRPAAAAYGAAKRDRAGSQGLPGVRVEQGGGLRSGGQIAASHASPGKPS